MFSSNMCLPYHIAYVQVAAVCHSVHLYNNLIGNGLCLGRLTLQS